jgi:GntR family phosphonate transport system transcriptional regulator
MTAIENATPDTPLERMAGVAMWSQIEQILAAEIGSGRFGKDGRLPTEGELAKRFDVNRHTVRRAMIGLASLGLVSVRQGRGTFVRPGAIDYTIGRRTRFSENLRQQHHAASVSPFGVMAPGVFAVMAPLETSNSRVRTGIKVA